MSDLNFELHHSYYDERLAAWTFNWDHWKGGRQLVSSGSSSSYLTQFSLEEGDGYGNRLTRSAGLYDNLSKRALEVYQSQLFRVPPRRDLPSKLGELEEDADTMGTPASDFFRGVVEYAQLFEMTHVLVDSPSIADGMDELTRQKMRLRPWFEHVPVFNLIDWEVEHENPLRRGQLNYAVIRDEQQFKTAAFTPPETKVRYRVWYTDRWEIWLAPRHENGEAGEAVMLAAGPNLLGIVPLITFYDRRLAPLEGTTVIDDVSLAANAMWNRASVEDESFQYQGFNQLVINSERDTATFKLGQSRALPLGIDEKAAFLTPSAVPTDAFYKFATHTIERVSDMVFGRTTRQSPSAQVESADKKRLDRQEMIAILNRKASNAERSEVACWQLAQLWSNTQQQQVTVDYNREFEPDMTEAEDWERMMLKGIRSRIDWYKQHNPGATEDEAKQQIEENLKIEEEFRKKGPQPPEFDGEAGTDALAQGTQEAADRAAEEAARRGESEAA